MVGARRPTRPAPPDLHPIPGNTLELAQDPHNGTRDSGKPTQALDEVIIRFAGDSGDGMQLTGSQFTRTTAMMGNDLATFPDFPAEIRAPAGTLPGVSANRNRSSAAILS